jgi:adenylate cyclase
VSRAGRGKQTTALLVGLAVLAAVIVLSLPALDTSNVFEMLENKTYDLRYNTMVRGAIRDTIKDVVIVEVDDYSVQGLGRFQNWPRMYHASIADYISRCGAAAIAFDFFFTETDSMNEAMAEMYHSVKTEGVVSEMLAAKLKFPERAVPLVINAVLNNWGYDREFADVAHFYNTVYFPFFLNMTVVSADSIKSDLAIRDRAFKFPPHVTRKYNYIYSEGKSLPIGQVLLPVPTLLDAARGTGYYNIEPDHDGVTRRIPLFLALSENAYPSMDLQVAMDLLGVKRDDVRVDLGKYIHLGDKRRIPINADGRMLITYFGPFQKFRYVSFLHVLAQQTPPEVFKDKIVIVGATAAGIYDMRVVPFSSQFPGPEIHANIIQTLMTGKFVRVLPYYVTLMIMVLVGLVTVAVSLRFKPLTAALILLGLLLAYLAGAYLLFKHQLMWVEIVRPVTVLLFTNMAILGYRYVTEEKQKLWIKDMFQGYMSKDLVDKIMANPDMLQMGGDKKEITVFFSDIKGFSSFSEKLGTPERLIALINEYLGAMSDVVLERGGYISKYEGDAIMAFWGAPSDDPDHARTCIECVWAMNQRLKELNADLATRDMPNLFTRFGINTGPVTVGNVGSVRKKSYTAMGDSVNLGSRLEGANKEYGTAIMMSEFTYEKVKGVYPVRELDMLRVVGKEQPVRVYELLGLAEADVPDKKRQAVERYLNGLACYRSRKWDEAAGFFQQALAIDPDDGPSQAYLERCRDFKQSPPPENWDGVYVMKTK